MSRPDFIDYTFLAFVAAIVTVLAIGISIQWKGREARRYAYLACVEAGDSEANCFARVYHAVQR